ncbi:MAG: hypothetical protein DMF66_12540 [Acidobacteria bacterium]|nr:MAG: hypothetical protein DMF66_12540 [Acidobacteriota bacterium]
MQRYIAKDDHPKIVYMPDTVDTTGEFQTSLRNLMGDHAVRKLTWGEFREIVWPGTLTVDRDNLPAWAAANLGRGLNQSDHQPVPMVDAVPAPDVLEVRRQFDDDMTVYHYAIGGNIAYGLPNSQSHLLKPYDMREPLRRASSRRSTTSTSTSPARMITRRQPGTRTAAITSRR